MSTSMQIRESEAGLVRLFAVNLPVREATMMRDTPDALAHALGVTSLDTEHLELIDLGDLAGMGLEGYLAEGHGIPEHELTPLRWQLDALEGAVLLLRSAAIPDRPATLTPRAPLRWVATFGEERPVMPIGTSLQADSAKGAQAAAPGPDTAGAGRWAVLLLAGLFAALALVLWLLM